MKQNRLNIKGKRGDEKPVGIILVMIFGILLLLFIIYLSVYKFTSATEEAAWKTSCAESVRAHALFGLREGITKKPAITCPIRDVTIDADLDSSRGQLQAKKEIAETMKDCWDVFGRGKYDLFTEEKVFCSVCSVIRFNEKDKELSGLASFLLSENVPGQRVTYSDYLTNIETSQARRLIGSFSPEQHQQFEGGRLSTSNDYGVIFVYAKGDDKISELGRHLTAQTTAGQVGAVISIGVGAGVLIFVSGPVGWGLAAVGVAASEAITYFFSEDNRPEWMAMLLLREYTREALSFCEGLPVLVTER